MDLSPGATKYQRDTVINSRQWYLNCSDGEHCKGKVVLLLTSSRSCVQLIRHSLLCHTHYIETHTHTQTKQQQQQQKLSHRQSIVSPWHNKALAEHDQLFHHPFICQVWLLIRSLTILLFVKYDQIFDHLFIHLWSTVSFFCYCDRLEKSLCHFETQQRNLLTWSIGFGQVGAEKSST